MSNENNSTGSEAGAMRGSTQAHYDIDVSVVVAALLTFAFSIHSGSRLTTVGGHAIPVDCSPERTSASTRS